MASKWAICQICAYVREWKRIFFAVTFAHSYILPQDRKRQINNVIILFHKRVRGYTRVRGRRLKYAKPNGEERERERETKGELESEREIEKEK